MCGGEGEEKLDFSLEIKNVPVYVSASVFGGMFFTGTFERW